MKNNNLLLNHIILNKIPCFFVSPHFDDAVLSSGSLIKFLSKKTKVSVVNVFTRAEKPPYSLSAKSYLKQCNYHNADKLYRDRMKEDQQVLNSLNVSISNLHFTDALWRKKNPKCLSKVLGSLVPELYYVYPIYLFIEQGKISKHDMKLLSKLSISLKIIPKKAIVFCPLGIGNHVDHVITSQVCTKLFKNVVFWSDFPYSIREKDKTNIKVNKFRKFVYSVNFSEKQKLIQGYKSQYAALFKDGKITKHQEIFYYRKEIYE